MRLVLAGDDGSDAAARAVAWAKLFAAERAVAVVAVRVGSSTQPDEDELGLERITISDRHPAAALMEVAADRDADLIVLGRRGAGGFPSLPIGTTAHVVAGSSQRPVAVIPPFHHPESPLVSRVVVGVDRMPGSRVALAWSGSAFPAARFSAVHALDLAPVFAHVEIDDPKAYDRAYESAVASMREQWCEPLVEARVKFETDVVEGAAAEVLLETARRTGADAVVVGRHEHGALQGTLGGVSQRVLAYSPCPAVVVPSAPTAEESDEQ
jgi:nucleotide-binding universal stress UspA family protein